MRASVALRALILMVLLASLSFWVWPSHHSPVPAAPTTEAPLARSLPHPKPAVRRHSITRPAAAPRLFSVGPPPRSPSPRTAALSPVLQEKLRLGLRKCMASVGRRQVDLTASGITSAELYALRDEGFLERLERGLYRLAELPEISQPDLVTIALKVPSGVICLISALAFHELTTQIPHEVSIALRRGSETPRLKFPPIRTHWFSADAVAAGIETHEIDGVAVRIYSAEKTLADCFKFRNKIGLDTAVEALRLYRERRKLNTHALMEYAAIDRVQNVMRPYLEAVL